MLANGSRTWALTGAGGFLGWHVKLALHANGHAFVEIPLGDHFDLENASRLLGQSDHLIHLAGVNRGSDHEISQGNRLFAEQIARAITEAKFGLRTITYANSTQYTNGSVYGRAKHDASRILSDLAITTGASYRDIILPNLFGEHGRPFYNSVVATFCYLLATGEGTPAVQADRELTLLHAQDAADWLIGAIDEPNEENGLYRKATVSDLLSRLQDMSTIYRSGEFPDLADPFARDLFNTYRSHLPTVGALLREHKDQRGSFTELARSWGGTGQSSFSTTYPGITRGNHYHRRKVERFAVLSGQATMQLRRMFTDQIIEVVTDGSPVFLDQPTGWTHNVTNTGDQTLYMFFWTNDIFDPEHADTVAEVV